jgi:aminoglycoside phosphotransferase (APT) family kinase protein
MNNIVGEGATAEIFEYGQDKVIKCVKCECNENILYREYAIYKYLMGCKLPLPKVYGVKEFQGKKGIVFQHIHGRNVVQAIKKRPFRIFFYIKKLAQIQAEIHNHTAPAHLPSVKEIIRERINNNHDIGSELKQKLLSQLDCLPEMNLLCHGDFHPNNVIIENDTYYVMDWLGCSTGDPLADVAFTIDLLRCHIYTEDVTPVGRIFLLLFRSMLAKKYVKEYSKIRKCDIEILKKWCVVRAAELMTGPFAKKDKNKLYQIVKELEP